MKKRHYNSLLAMGLNDKEARVYLALLSLGETSVAAVAAEASIKRPTVYPVIEKLEERALVARRKDGAKESVRALSPYTIIEHSRKATDTFATQIPDILEFANRHTSTPQIEVFAGPEGMERSMNDRLNAKTELYFWADNNLQFTHKKFAFGQQSDYLRNRIKRGIWTRGLIPYEKSRAKLREARLSQTQDYYMKLKKEGEKKLREFVFVPKANYQKQTEIWIYDNIVDFYSSNDFVGARIENPGFAETMRSIFLFQLSLARKEEQSILSKRDRTLLVP